MNKRTSYILLLIILATKTLAQEYQSEFIRRQPKDIEQQKAVYAQMKENERIANIQDYQNNMLSDSSKYISNAFNDNNNKPQEASPFHVSVDLSAFASLGKNTSNKGGFGQNISLNYNSPISKDDRLWINTGGYFNNIYYGGENYYDAGLFGTLGYTFNEHWDAYLYGQLSIANNYQRLWGNYLSYNSNRYVFTGIPFLLTNSWKDSNLINRMAGANVIGAGATYHVNKNFSVGVNFEVSWYNRPLLDR